MTEKCGRCGQDPASGFATIDDVRYCHGVSGWELGDFSGVSSCYDRQAWEFSQTADAHSHEVAVTIVQDITAR